MTCHSYGGDLVGLRKLLKKGVDVNCRDKDGRTPLYFAAYQGHSQIVDALIEKGAHLEIKDNEGTYFFF
jgi:ankyrin repeat protein